jgi:hypothetical protein
MLWSLGVEHAILDTESRRNAAFSSVSEQPRCANLRWSRALLTTIRRRERALSIDQLGDLSIASSSARKCLGSVGELSVERSRTLNASGAWVTSPFPRKRGKG